MLLMQAAHEKNAARKEAAEKFLACRNFAAGRTIFPLSCRDMCF